MRSLMFLALATLCHGDAPLTTYIPASVLVPSHGSTAALTIPVPSAPGELSLATPAALYGAVQQAYAAVVEGQQSGLVDAKTPWLMSAPLHPSEAWHHAQAAAAGVLDSARFLITFSLVPSLQTGGSPAHLAAALGQEPELRALLAAAEAASVGGGAAAANSARASDGLAPLHFAAAMGHGGCIAALLQHGAEAEAVGRNGATPLAIAASFGHLAAVQALLAGGAQAGAPHAFAGTTPLHFAAEMGRVEVIAALCQAGASAGARTSSGGTPLHTAADTNQSHSVRALLAPPCSADPNALLNGDTTPVYLAAQRGLTAVLAALAAGGADLGFAMPAAPFRGEVVAAGGGGLDAPPPGGFYEARNTKRGNGATALHAAVENGHAEAVAWLLAAGVQQSTAMEGASPLLLALQYRHPEIALQLLQAGGREGAHVNAHTPHDGQFPLAAAAQLGYVGVAAALLAAGANASAVDRQGRGAAHFALAAGHVGVAEVIIRGGGVAGGGAAASSALAAAMQGKRAGALKAVLQGAGGGEALRALLSGTAALTTAAGKCWAEGVGVLLAAGAEGAEAALQAVCAAGCPGSSGAQVLQELLRALASAGGEAAARAAARAPASRQLDGATPLHLAAGSGDVESMLLLLGVQGVDARARLRKSQASVLAHAAARGQAGAVTALLRQRGGELLDDLDRAGRSVFHAAALGGGPAPTVTALAAAAGNSSRQGWVNLGDGQGITPLHACAASAHCTPQAVLALLAAGAQAGKGGCSAEGVSIAAAAVAGGRRARDKVGLLRALVGKGGGRGVLMGNLCKAGGAAPLALAVETGEVELVRGVLEVAGEGGGRELVQEAGDGGQALLRAAVAAGAAAPELVKLLLEHAAAPGEAVRELVRSSSSLQHRTELLRMLAQ